MSVGQNIKDGVYKNNLTWTTGRTPEAISDRHDYRTEDTRIRSQFRQDLAIEHGVYQHSKEPKLWDLAWEFGGGTLSEVAGRYEDMVELIK